MIGKKLSPVLVEIEDTLWEFELNAGMKPEFTDEGFQAGVKIFMSVMMDKMYSLQTNEDMSMKDRAAMATKLGNDLRNMVKTYTDVDTHEMFK